MRRTPPSEWRNHLKIPETQVRPRTMEYVGRQTPELRGRTALVLPGRRSGLVIAQFDFPEGQETLNPFYPPPHDHWCFGWHPFTEGEFRAIEETPRERRRREWEEKREGKKAYQRALADFGREVRYYEPLPIDPEPDDDWEREMDHLVGLDGWGRDP